MIPRLGFDRDVGRLSGLIGIRRHGASEPSVFFCSWFEELGGWVTGGGAGPTLRAARVFGGFRFAAPTLR